MPILLQFGLRCAGVTRTMTRMQVRSMSIGTMMLRIGIGTLGRLILIKIWNIVNADTKPHLMVKINPKKAC